MSQRYTTKNPFSKFETFTEKSRFDALKRVWQAASNTIWTNFLALIVSEILQKRCVKNLTALRLDKPVYLCTFLLFWYILGCKTITIQNRNERKEMFVYELIIIFFIIYLLHIYLRGKNIWMNACMISHLYHTEQNQKECYGR
jgi:hypothetical protein